MTDEKFLRLWGKARRRGYWVYTLTGLLYSCFSCAVAYAGLSWFFDMPIDPLMPAILTGIAAIVQLAVGTSAWRSREEKYHRLMAGRSVQAFD